MLKLIGAGDSSATRFLRQRVQVQGLSCRIRLLALRNEALLFRSVSDHGFESRMNCHLSDYRICLAQISKWLRRLDARQVSDLPPHEPLRSPGSKTPTSLIHSRQVEDLPRISMAQPGGKVSWVTLAPLTYSALNAAPPCSLVTSRSTG